MRYLHTEPLIVGSGIKTGIKITSENPKEIGPDRIVDVVAAYEKYGGPVLVLDFGTATTYDLVTEDGRFGVGITAPGIRISAKALWEDTARLPEVEIKKPDSILRGKRFPVCRQVWFTDRSVDRIYHQSGQKRNRYHGLKVVATGGLGRIIADETDTIDIYDSALTLDGLRILYEKNCSGK